MKATLLTALLLTSNVFAQDAPCPPPMVPMNSTVRLPDSGVIIAVSEFDGDTRTVVSSYEYPEWIQGQIGTFSGAGDVTFTNKTDQNRRMKYRISVLMPEGSEPQIPDTLTDVLCWEPETSRIIGVFEAVVNANQEVVVPIQWDLVVRNAGMLADLNNDGRVDGTDQGILFGAFGTDDAIADLNGDGIVDSADLGILLSNWSDYSEDTIETSDASGGTDYNTLWRTADHIFRLTLNELPNQDRREGHYVIPKAEWRLT